MAAAKTLKHLIDFAYNSISIPAGFFSLHSAKKRSFIFVAFLL